ncbi:MAG: hypothetical protein AAGA69_03165 [Pseudomonadota bacterium]
MRHSLSLFTGIASFTMATAHAEIPRYSEACETELALSAGPVYMREDAGVYVLGSDGFELVRESKNGFVCIVERDSDESLIPQCFDRLGQLSHIPPHKDSVKKRLAGMEWDQIKKERQEGFDSGQYSIASGPGVVYMASDYNLAVSTDGKTRTKIAPHVMYHAPNLTNEDIGSDPRLSLANRGMPFIIQPGPLGFMVSFTEKPTNSSAVISACKDELPDIELYQSFPPQHDH